jgi:hypothetical protein
VGRQNSNNECFWVATSTLKRIVRIHESWENETPLTQVVAESLARRQFLAASGKFILYSILTDISGLYVLWYEVNDGNSAVDMCWVSRQETDPERFVAIIYWLCLCSMGKSTVSFDPLWKQETDAVKPGKECGKKDGEGEEEGSTHGSELPSIDEAVPTNDDSQRSKQTGAEQEECEEIVISFDDSDEEREAELWETFYAIENHRISGTSLSLTTDLLELRTINNSEKDVVVNHVAENELNAISERWLLRSCGVLGLHYRLLLR